MTNSCFDELSTNPINPIPYELNVVSPIKGFLTTKLSWKYIGLIGDGTVVWSASIFNHINLIPSVEKLR